MISGSLLSDCLIEGDQLIEVRLINISLTVFSMKGPVYFVFLVSCRCTQFLSSLHASIES